MLKFHSKMKKLENHICMLRIVEASFIVTIILSIATFVLAISVNAKTDMIWFMSGSILSYITSTLLYRYKNQIKYNIKRYSIELEEKYDINLEYIREEIGE